MSTDLHATRESLDARLPDLRALGTDEGTLELIVVRPSEGERETPDTAELTIEDGLVGDRWHPHVDADGTACSATTNSRSRRPASSGSSPTRSAGRSPATTCSWTWASTRRAFRPAARLAIGDTVVVQISEEPHTGCAKYSARFGSDALKFVNSPEGRELRLRA